MNKRTPHRRSNSFRAASLAGWIFLGAAIALAVAVIVLLAGQKEPEIPDWEPTYPTNQTVAAPTGGSLSGAEGGTGVIIDGILCSFTPPTELTFGVVESLDLSSVADTVCANVRSAGWGDVVCSFPEDGSLLFYRQNAAALSGDKFEAQAEFMAGSRPEALARTFLSDSGLYGLLSAKGVELSLDIDRQDGAMVFRGSSQGLESESWVRLSFLYDGSLNQMKVYAVHLADAVTTQSVVPMEKAASQAVSWTSAGTAATQVTAVEIRSISGIPFYVFTCADGTTAYAAAVEESALEASPRVMGIYDQLMLTGIQEYVRLEGAGF